MSDFIINTDGLKEKFEKEFEDFKKSIKRPNILTIGKTGVGKSSLVNVIFGKKLAEISDVKPQTRGFHMYSTESVPVNIIDSEGYELGNPDLFKTSLKSYINDTFTSQEKQIHLAWYCISAPGDRVLPYDIENIRCIIEEKIPVAVVITKCDMDDADGSSAQAIKETIDKAFSNKVPSFQTSNDTELNQELDLNALIDWSCENISDENIRKGFAIAQVANIEKKDDLAKAKIKYYAGVAAGIGGSPIPMSDAALLTALQVTMTSHLFTIYGIDNSLSNTLRQTIEAKIISLLGKCIAGNLLKLIPGLGTAAGALINAAVASSITYSLGYAICELCKKVLINTFEGAELISEIFTEEKINELVDLYMEKNK